MSQKRNPPWLNAGLIIAAGFLGYALTLWLDGGGRPPNIQKIEEAAPLPEFSFVDLAGKSYTSTEFRGKVVLINFWATWCPPCVVEFPQLLKIAADNPDDVVLIALSSDAGDDVIRAFLQKQAALSPNVIVARDAADVTLKVFGISKLPETIVAGPDLKQRERLVGAEWDPKVLQKIIDSL